MTVPEIWQWMCLNSKYRHGIIIICSRENLTFPCCHMCYLSSYTVHSMEFPWLLPVRSLEMFLPRIALDYFLPNVEIQLKHWPAYSFGIWGIILRQNRTYTVWIAIKNSQKIFNACIQILRSYIVRRNIIFLVQLFIFRHILLGNGFCFLIIIIRAETTENEFHINFISFKPHTTLNWVYFLFRIRRNFQLISPYKDEHVTLFSD